MNLLPGLKSKKRAEGFTLLEVVVYVFVFVLVVGGMAAIVLALYRHKTIIEDRVNVNEDLRLLTKSMRDDIYLGSDLVLNSSSNLTIVRAVGDDVVYYLSNGRVFRQEGIGDPIAITAITTNVTEFDMTDLSSPTTAKTIRLEATLSNYPGGSIKPEIRQEVETTFTLKFVY